MAEFYYNRVGHINFISYPCIRAFLLLINLSMWLFGLTLIWIGVWIQTDLLKFVQISMAYKERVPYIVMLIGAIIIFAASLACSCIVRVKSSLLVIYGGFLITILFSLISLSVYVFTYKDELISGLSNGVKHEIAINGNLNKMIDKQRLIDIIQINLQCCGDKSFLDWPQQNIPSSCIQRTNYQDASSYLNNVYQIGCTYKLINLINKWFIRIGTIISAMSLFPLFGAVLAFSLAIMYSKSNYEMII